MSGEVKNSNQRLKLLYLCKILAEETDSEHHITMPRLIKRLEDCGISASRYTLYDDIEALCAYGIDINLEKGKNPGYYIGSRDFELSELKLLVDAVVSSRFLTAKKSEELVKKLQGLTSRHESGQLRRQVYTTNRVKAFNEEVLYSVDAIHKAIAEGRKIAFKYFDYDISKKKRYRDEERVCSPYALTWDDERYYLIAYSDRHPDRFTHYRVDRMEKVRVLTDTAQKIPDGFNLAEYMNSTFSMFSGDTREVRLRFHRSLVNVVLDRFGNDIILLPDGEEHFIVRVKVKTEQTFLAWLFQFAAKTEILEPAELRERYKRTLEEVTELYR